MNTAPQALTNAGLGSLGHKEKHDFNVSPGAAAVPMGRGPPVCSLNMLYSEEIPLRVWATAESLLLMNGRGSRYILLLLALKAEPIWVVCSD